MRGLVLRRALRNIRFAPNPVSELALSSMIVRYPERHPFHRAWYSQTTTARARVGEERILVLLDERKKLIDTFMRPAGPRATTFDQEMGRLAKFPPTIFRRDAEEVWGTSLPSLLGRTDESVKTTLLQILRDYWEACFAEYWPSFKKVLDADVTYRAQQLASQGAAATLREVQPRFIIDGEDILVPYRQPGGFETDVGPRGITLLPTLVKWGMNTPNAAHADLVMSYRARGRGRLQDGEAETAPGLVGVFGKVRTELLLSLDEPASSTAIALFMGVTTSAVNQHLRALAAAGLLQTSRFGRYVLYSRTHVADQLIAPSKALNDGNSAPASFSPAGGG